MGVHEFQFVAELPPTKRRSAPEGLLEAFAEALKGRPGEWAMWPVPGANPSSYTSDIKNGWMKPFRGGGFDAISRNSILYVRYVGEEVTDGRA